MMKLQVESEVGMVSLGAWVMCRRLKLPMESVTFYSDSMYVLWWIRDHGRSFNSFVANRIGETQMVSEPLQWQHLPTKENPANLCTRGATPD